MLNSIGSKQDTVRLRYSTIQFEPSSSEAYHIENSKTLDLQPSPGMFCPQTSLSWLGTFPELPSQFSVQIETFEKDAKSVSYSELHYKLKHKLVTMKFSPQHDSSPLSS